MNFTTGQVVIHPHHGPATVTKIFTRTIRGKRIRCFRLDVHDSELSVAVPVERAEEIGLRPTIDLAGVRELIDVLLATGEPQDTVWSRRVKHNSERLRSGNIQTIAALIRDLARQNEVKRLAFGEMTMLRDATGPLVAELALVLDMDKDEVAAMVDAVVLEGTVPSLPEPALATAS